MKRLFKFAPIAVVVLLIAIALAYLALPFVVSRESLQSGVVQSIEETMEGAFAFDDVAISYFPVIQVRFSEVRLEGSDERVKLDADQFILRVDMLKLLFGKFEASSLHIEKANLLLTSVFGEFLEQVSISNLNASINAAKDDSMKKLIFSGNVADFEESLEGELLLDWEAFLSWDWRLAALEGSLQVRNVDLAEMEDKVKFNLPMNLMQGMVAAQLTIAKASQQGWVEISGQTQMPGFQYELIRNGLPVASLPMNLVTDFKVAWNPSTEDLSIKRFKLEMPAGVMEVQGRLSLATGQIEDVRVTLAELSMEAIPNYWISLRDVMPLNTGFSGPSTWDLSLSGTWDHLLVHANVDFTDAILTYSKLFSKSKGIPLTVTSELLIKENNLISGDFSLRSLGANGKGTLTDFEFDSGEGQFNLITNKFPIGEWASIIIPFQDYEISGNVKLLTNWEGNLYKWDELKKILNLTLNNGRFARKDGEPIENIDLSVDVGDLAFEIKKADFDIMDSNLTMGLSVYNWKENPRVSATLESGELEPYRVIDTLQDISLEWLTPESSRVIENAKEWLTKTFPQNQKSQNLKLKLDYEDRELKLGTFEVDAYGGQAALNGSLWVEADKFRYEGEVEFTGWDMKSFFQSKGFDPSLEGLLYLKTNVTGEDHLSAEGDSFLRGGGKLLIATVDFKDFDLVKEIAAVSGLETISLEPSGSTYFDDISSQFTLEDDKIIMESVRAISEDISIRATGEARTDGLLNYRLEVFLEPHVTKTYIDNRGLSLSLNEDAHLGPIPFIVTGSIDKFQLVADSEALPDLISALSETGSGLQVYLEEDPLLEREVPEVPESE